VPIDRSILGSRPGTTQASPIGQVFFLEKPDFDWGAVMRASPLSITVLIVAGSAFIYSPGIGYGGWLPGTLPASPWIYLVFRLVFRFTKT
jgi:hypothetical protein